MRIKCNQNSLIKRTQQVFVVAHKEDTTRLEETLRAQGFDVFVQRGPYTAEQETYASNTKCLINHANVWKRIVETGNTAIVVEADFVPVCKFASRSCPLPLDTDNNGVGFAWLYSAGSILYGFDQHGFPHGHGNTTVAYLLTPPCASILLDFFTRETARFTNGKYTQWETYLGIYLRKERGILNYIPIYQYGEHGGSPQPEHARHGIRSWHQADILLDRLEFLPGYARGSRLRYIGYRSRSIARGWARLCLLRFYDPRYINGDTTKGRISMGFFSVVRLLRLWPRA